MKNNIYIFSNSKVSRKNDSFTLESIPEIEPVHKVDFYEEDFQETLLPASQSSETGKKKHIPAESVESFYSFGEIRFNTQFLKCLSIYSVPLHIFNYAGNYVGSFIPKNSQGAGQIEILQYEAYANEQKRKLISKSMVGASIKNILDFLKNYAYQGANLDEPIAKISSHLDAVRFADSIEEIMGYEGIVRNIYYGCWTEIFNKDVNFIKREKRPPIGMINSLISFGNAIIYAVCLSEIYRTRLNPFIGFTHETGDHKHPLVYDLSDIFKPFIVDRVIFRVVNLNMIDEKDFTSSEKGMYLKDDARKKFVAEIENRLSTVILHKTINRRLSYRSLIRMECYKIINFLLGKIKKYEPYKSS